MGILRTYRLLLLPVLFVLLAACVSDGGEQVSQTSVTNGGQIGSQLFAAASYNELDAQDLLPGDAGEAIYAMMDRGDQVNLKTIVVQTKLNKTASWTNTRRSTTYRVTLTSDNAPQASSSALPRCRDFEVTMQRDDSTTSTQGRICWQNNSWQPATTDVATDGVEPTKAQDDENNSVRSEGGLPPAMSAVKSDDPELFGVW